MSFDMFIPLTAINLFYNFNISDFFPFMLVAFGVEKSWTWIHQQEVFKLFVTLLANGTKLFTQPIDVSYLIAQLP